jgi:hypothetical protein
MDRELLKIFGVYVEDGRLRTWPDGWTFADAAGQREYVREFVAEFNRNIRDVLLGESDAGFGSISCGSDETGEAQSIAFALDLTKLDRLPEVAREKLLDCVAFLYEFQLLLEHIADKPAAEAGH